MNALQGQTETALKSPENKSGVRLSGSQMLGFGGILLAVLIAVFWDFCKAQFLFAIRYPSDWGHTLLIPGIAGWMIWLKRDELARLQPFKPSWMGLPLVAIGLAFYLVALVGPSWFAVHHNARALGVAITLFGLVILLLGWKSLGILWFPLCYLVVFFQTYTDRILQTVTEQLQDISAKGGYLLITVIGIEADISGNVITVFPTPSTPQSLNIAEACSGMRMLVAFLALGVALAWTGLDHWWQRIFMIVLAVPVAVFVNMLRVATLGVLALWDMELTTGEFHQFVGFIWLVPAFVAYMGIMWVIRRLVVDEDPKASDSEVAA
jgi:exosortase